MYPEHQGETSLNVPRASRRNIPECAPTIKEKHPRMYPEHQVETEVSLPNLNILQTVIFVQVHLVEVMESAAISRNHFAKCCKKS